MYVHDLVKLDKYTNIIPLPRLILMTRSFDALGIIPHYTGWRASIRGNELDEISFEVPKYYNGVLNPIWDDLIDLKIVSVEQSGKCGKFEIQVTYTDETQTTKSVTGVSLETELGQVALYDFHVNDDFAIEAEDYEVTVLYNPQDEEHSLLHRVLKDKAPQWSIDPDRMTEYVISDKEGVPESVTEFQREYTVDGTSIYDFLTGEVAKDANVVFRFNTDNRTLWCESLLGYQGDEEYPTVDAIGEDTTILVSKRKLGNNITINSNKDSVKNCFRIEGGDDLMTSQVAVVNMTGTNYIYHFADFQLDDMPITLKTAILAYEEYINSSEMQEAYYGDEGIYTQYVETNEEYYYLKDEKAPSIHIDPPESAEAQWDILKAKLEDNDMYIGVSDLTSYDSSHYVGVTNNVQKMLEIWADQRYSVEVLKEPSPTYNATTNVWTGIVRVTRVSDTNDHYPPIETTPIYSGLEFTAKIAMDSDTDLTYTRQKVEIALAQGDMTRVDAEFNEQTTYAEMVEYFEEWNLEKLKSFQIGYQTCQSVLMEGKVLKNGTTIERQIADALLEVYNTRLKAVNEVLLGADGTGTTTGRQAEVDALQTQVELLFGQVRQFQEDLAFDKYLRDNYGDLDGHLYTIYRSYIREDTYQNSNYVSDSLDTQTDLIENAEKLYHQAERQLKESCVLQRTLSVSLNNLLALSEFEPLYSKFELFNYIRIRTDDEVLKLRLIGVDYSGDSMETIEVTFSDQIESVDGNISDLQSVLDQAKSIATSFSSVQVKAEQGAEAKDYVNSVVEEGLNASSTMLKNSDDNEVEISRAGIIAKRMDDQGIYGDKQLRIIGNGMYMTETAWGEHPQNNKPAVSMAVGEIYFYDPTTRQSNWRYGVIADALVGNLIVGQNLYIGNDSGSVEVDGSGIKITNGTITWGHPQTPQDTGVEPPDSDDIYDTHGSTTQTLSTTLTGVDTSIGTLNTFKTQVENSLNTTVIGSDYIISPKIGGGYLYLVAKDANDNIKASVEINPSGGTIEDDDGDTTSGYIIKATGTVNGSLATLFSLDTSGSAYFNGAIETISGHIGGWQISTNAISKTISAADSSDGKTHRASLNAHPSFTSIEFSDTEETTGQTIDISTELSSDRLLFSRDVYTDRSGELTLTLTQRFYMDYDSTYSKTGYFFNYLGTIPDGFPANWNQGIYFNSKVSVSGSGYNESKFDITPKEISLESKLFYIDADVEISAGKLTLNASTIDSALTPDSTTTYDIGSTIARWNTVYCVTVNQSSDERLKENIISVSDKYEDMFMGMRPVLYNFKSDKNKTHLGFVAQEIEGEMTKNNIGLNQFGGLVKEAYKTKEGETDYSYGLNYSEITALNTHMIQKLYKRVEELEKELAALKK